jgi:hypothetical protein
MKAGRAKNKWNVRKEMERAVNEIQERMRDVDGTRNKTEFADSILGNKPKEERNWIFFFFSLLCCLH